MAKEVIVKSEEVKFLNRILYDLLIEKFFIPSTASGPPPLDINQGEAWQIDANLYVILRNDTWVVPQGYAVDLSRNV